MTKLILAGFALSLGLSFSVPAVATDHASVFADLQSEVPSPKPPHRGSGRFDAFNPEPNPPPQRTGGTGTR